MQIFGRRGINQLTGVLFSCGLLSGIFISTAVPGHAQQQSVSLRLDEVISRAQAAQQADHYAEAAAAYAEATTINPRLPELWANRGLMEHFAGDPAHAIQSFQRALASKPSLYTAVLFTGIDLVALNETERALPYLKRALSLKPSNSDTYEALGKAYMALHDPERSASSYQEAVALRASSASALYGLGVASLELIDRNGGVLAKRHSKSPWALALYADEMLVQGRMLEASDGYKQVAAISTDLERKTFVAALEKTRNSPTSSADPSVLQTTIDRLLVVLQATSSSNLALCTTQNTTSARKYDVARQKMACAYLQNHVSESATAAAKKLALNSDDPEALYWSVKANEARAVDSLAQFERIAPQSAVTYVLVGDLYRRRMDSDRAIEQYAKALTIDPHDSPALLGKAAAYLAIGNMEESITAAETALADSPQNGRLNLIMAESLVNLHRYSEAAPYLDRCIAATKADPRIIDLAPRAHALLGTVLTGSGDISGAITEMTLGLPCDRDGSLHYQLSRLYRRQGKVAEANAAETEAKSLIAQRRSHAEIAIRSSTTSWP